ncbi:MAG TPA: hypothetical protein VGF48_10290 [Thermoanaerobaculia bacterium]|jgi:hypothetical protein
MLFKAGGISYTIRVNGFCQLHGLYWLIDFIAAQQKRIRKDQRFKGGQRWVHRVSMRRATVYCYALEDDEDPLVFPQRLYSEVVVPEITFYLTDDVVMTKEDRDAPL